MAQNPGIHSLELGESELYAAFKSAAETFRLMSMLKDLNLNLPGKVSGDASVALGVVNRTVLGKPRHIDTSVLWIHQTAAERHLGFHTVFGERFQLTYALSILMQMPVTST